MWSQFHHLSKPILIRSALIDLSLSNMSDQKTSVERLKFLGYQVLHLNQRDVAAQLGYSQGLIGQIETGKMDASTKLVRALVERFNVNPDWITDGIEPVFPVLRTSFRGRHFAISPPDDTRPGYGDFRVGDLHYVMIRRVDLSIPAGSGVVALAGFDATSVALPAGWLSTAGVNADLAVLVRVKGDRMAPSIPDGAYVLIHLPEKQVPKPGIYAFSRDGQPFVKRLVPTGTDAAGRAGSIMILSEIPAFLPEVVTGSDLNDLRIVGRVHAVLPLLD